MAHPGDRFRVRAEFPRGLGSLEDRSPAPEAAAFRLGRSLSRQRRRHAPGHAARARIAPAGRGAGHPVPGPAARRAPPRLRAGARAADAVHRRCPGHAAAPAAHGRQHLPGRLHAGTQPRPLERRYPARAGAPLPARHAAVHLVRGAHGARWPGTARLSGAQGRWRPTQAPQPACRLRPGLATARAARAGCTAAGTHHPTALHGAGCRHRRCGRRRQPVAPWLAGHRAGCCRRACSGRLGPARGPVLPPCLAR